MKETLKKQWARIKEAVSKIAPKTRKLLLILLAVAVGVSAAVAIGLNVSGNSMTELYPDMSKTETAQAFAALSKATTVQARMNNGGFIEVPKKQLAEAQLVLAENGIPQTTNTYKTFLDNTSFTMTESEKQQLLVMQTQDSLTQTLLSIDGVDTCIVNLNIAAPSDRVWEQTGMESTGSVLIGMKNGYKLSPERVSGIKNLVAYSIPNASLNAANIRVIDAATGIDMEENASLLPGGQGDYTRLEYERTIERQYEQKILSLLNPMYPDGGVTAVVTARLNYDKVKQEDHEVIPGENNEGIKTHQDVDYTVGGNPAVGDLVGEENNTDVPGYQNNMDENGSELTDYHSSTDWDISRRTIQTEKGTATIEYISAAVLVEDGNFTAEQTDRIKSLVSKATGIPSERLSVEYFGKGGGISEPAAAPGKLSMKTILIIGGIALGVLLILIVIIIIFSKAGSKKRKQAEAEQKQAEDLLRNAQQEVEDRKRALADAAQASNAKENGIADDIRQFARDNPEITANLIRSMLKEDE